MEKYKYLKRADSYASEDALNKLGEEGWKLISVVKSNGDNSFFDFYFMKKG